MLSLPGSRVHGGEFIQFALRMGAAAVLTDAEPCEVSAGTSSVTIRHHGLRIVRDLPEDEV